MLRFVLPRNIYIGKKSLAILKTLNGKKAIIIIGVSSMRKFGFLDKVTGYLKQANIEVKVVEGVEPNPSVETVMNGAAVMREFEPDLIISIGGGSAIDAAKAMWIFYEYPELTFEQAIVPFRLPELRQKAKFVAIPSTSGSGTEVTAFSIITDYKNKIKYPIADFNIVPDIAIIDPELAYTMPQELIAHTGMDALTHGIEAYVGAHRSSFSDPLAMESITMVNEYLLKSYNGDKEAKNQMHSAQCLAGMAFSNALVGISHSMAHKTGVVFHIPHGCANAIYLPYVIQYNSKKCSHRYAAIASRLNLSGQMDEELTDSLINWIKDLNIKMDIPLTLKSYGITEEEFLSNIESISHNAVLDPCTGSNPRKIDDKTMERLFTCIYNGDKVTF